MYVFLLPRNKTPLAIYDYALIKLNANIQSSDNSFPPLASRN